MSLFYIVFAFFVINKTSLKFNEYPKTRFLYQFSLNYSFYSKSENSEFMKSKLRFQSLK